MLVCQFCSHQWDPPPGVYVLDLAKFKESHVTAGPELQIEWQVRPDADQSTKPNILLIEIHVADAPMVDRALSMPTNPQKPNGLNRQRPRFPLGSGINALQTRWRGLK